MAIVSTSWRRFNNGELHRTRRHPARGLRPAPVPRRRGGPRLRARRGADPGAGEAEGTAQSRRRARRGPGPRRRRPGHARGAHRRRAGVGEPRRDRGADADRARRPRRIRTRDRGRRPARRQQVPRRALRVVGEPLHAVRGRRVPKDHLVPRPPGRDGALSRAHRRGPGALPRDALERQRGRTRRPGGRPPVRRVGGPVPEAELPIRPRRGSARVRRGPVHDPLGARGGATHLRRAPQHRPLRPRDGLAQARDALGRRGLRSGVRPRHLHDRRGRRLQHGGDGEQGAQHLQLGVRARPPRHRHRPGLRRDRDRHRARVLPQLDRQPRDLPRLVPVEPQGRPDGVPRPAVHRRHVAPRGQAHPRRAPAPHPPVRGGRRPDGAPRAPRLLRRDRQLLHRHHLQQGRRGHPHAAHPARRRDVQGGRPALLRAPRWSGGHHRRLRRVDGGCIGD